MRRLLAVAAALACLPSLASAGPVTIGAGLGLSQGQSTATGGASDTTYGLFGRIALGSRVAAQVELQRTDVGRDTVDDRSYSGLLLIDLGAGPLVPMLLGGGGLDRATVGGGPSETEAHHVEGGLGLEYRSPGGVVIGVDARAGELDIDSQPVFNAYFCPVSGCPSMSTLHAGDYESVRITAGVRF